MGREVNENVGNQSPEGGSHSAQLLEQSTDNNAWQRAVADNSRGTDMNKLGFPDANIVQAQYRPEQQGERFDPRNFANHGDVYNPVQPIGLEGRPGETWQGRRDETNHARNNYTPPEHGRNGSTTYNYMGTAGPDNRPYGAKETIAADGSLVGRGAIYPHGMPMLIESGPKEAMRVNVHRISTTPRGDGSYVTEIHPYHPDQRTRESMKPYVAITQPNGNTHFVKPGER